MSQTPQPAQIVPYRDEFAADFDRLNREWLERYHLLEPLDEEMLRFPRQHILDPGGRIYIALDGTQVVGTCAGLWHEPGVLELVKLSVATSARGQGLGRKLVEVILDFAREAKAHKVILVSNSQLATAIRLYQQLGFQHRPLPRDVGYETADVYMELDLPASG